jgi:hypothetical protein
MRQDRFVEGALQAKYQDSEKDKNKFFRKNQASSSSKYITNQYQNKGKIFKRNFSPCQHCNKIGHPSFKC